jgi:uncharacterized repeat protein (TIGR03806 family)
MSPSPPRLLSLVLPLTWLLGCGSPSSAPPDEPPPPPLPAPYGLDARPSGQTCKAPARPQLDTGVRLNPVFAAGTFSQPIDLQQAPGDSATFYIAERPGRIRKISRGGTVAGDFLVFPAGVINAAGEGGFLGFAFHPAWKSGKPEVYLSYTTTGGTTGMRSVIARVRSSDGGQSLDAATIDPLLTIDQPFTNHNGGGIHFGPDGFLYVGFGDGGSAGDPQKNGQERTRLLGKFIRIDINRADAPRKYGIPATNPFASGGGAPEIFALGFRNPWRWSFDRGSGDLWVADVGQDRYEEINRVRLGGNYGWSVREGSHCYPSGTSCATSGLIDPLLEYPRADGKSITGGYVYRGKVLPGLVGKFIFGDYESGNVWSLNDDGRGNITKTLLTTVPAKSLVSFGQDADGEVYTLNIATGLISQLVPAAAPPPSSFPQRLSQTGCVDSQDPKRPAATLIPFTPLAELWSDGASKERYLALPDGAQITIGADGDFTFPRGTVLVKHFELAGRRVETRLLILHDDGIWAGYSYEWDDAGGDATLLPSSKSRDLPGGLTWLYPSRSDCNSCHTDAAGNALGPELAQINHAATYPSTNRLANQLATWRHIGLFANPPSDDPATLPSLPAPHDPQSGSPADRARAYLHGNCSFCHRPNGGGRGDLDLRFSTSLRDSKACGTPAQIDTLGLPGAQIIRPGAPESSVLLLRMGATDARRMPQVGSRVVDSQGSALVGEFIRSLTACP